MRFDTPIFFQKITQGAYDSSTGNYAYDSISEVERYAAVTDTQTEIKQILYGGISQNGLTVRIQNGYNRTFDYIRIGKVRYKVDGSRKLRTKQVYYVSEVQ